MPQELLSFFRLNKKHEKSRLRMYRTDAIASILKIPRTYSEDSTRDMADDPCEEEETAARDLRRIRISRSRRIYDRPIFSDFFFLVQPTLD